MQDLKVYIAEKLDISKDYSGYNYQPKDKKDLKKILDTLIKERGPEGDFNDIDTSLITDMSDLFAYNLNFNGDISRWNISKVTDMSYMFSGATRFDCDISRWDTSNVTNMQCMFERAFHFNQ
ncbi:MAG: BspA family leucine-rich repeat surface protein, partial [Bacteroidaceae bacterium]|nr:BspA family leucine-rich repeat surface protein [Bacteroidaceae bacterium]